jgi:inner membrane protein
MTKKNNRNIIDRAMTMGKAVAIGAMILLMLIPLNFVQSMIDDRDRYRSEAVSKITDSWGSDVVIAAPILNIPYLYEEKEITDEKTIKTTTKTGYAKYAPDDLNTEVKTTSQIRYIGIFQVPVFTAEITITGKFNNLSDMEPAGKIQDAFVSVEINNLKGISVPDFTWNKNVKVFGPNNGANTLSYVKNPKNYDNYYYQSSNLNALISGVEVEESNEFELKFTIKGSESLSFYPIAKNNKIHMSSDWQNPNFSGAFLPEIKEIRDDGFDAFWDINYLASGISLRLDKSIVNIFESRPIASFIIPVDNYKNATRAVKYGILFIVLTFAVCFAFEVAGKKPIHPIQYLLVGFAMVIFYTLLISISEFVNFSLSYFIAAAATISLISAYIKFGIVKDMGKKQTIIVVLSLSFLYGFLYILLQLQDMALLYGSIGLFAALAAIMYIMRNINWYEEIDTE